MSDSVDVRVSDNCPIMRDSALEARLQKYIQHVDGVEHYVKTAVALDNLAIECNDAGDDFSSVTGVVLVVSKNTPVNRLRPAMRHLETKILTAPLNDTAISVSDSELRRLAASRAIAASMRDELRVRKAASLDGAADEPWALSFGHGGRHASLVGRYNKRGKRSASRVVVDAGMEAQANKLVEQYAGKTVGELTASREYERLRSYSATNARGLAAAFCEQLDLEGHVEMAHDPTDRDAGSETRHPRPLLAGDSVSMAATSSLFAAGDTVTVFSGAIDTTTALGDHIVVTLNADTGVMIVPRSDVVTHSHLLYTAPARAGRAAERQELSSERANDLMNRIFYPAKGTAGASDAVGRIMGRVEYSSDSVDISDDHLWSPVLSVVTGH